MSSWATKLTGTGDLRSRAGSVSIRKDRDYYGMKDHDALVRKLKQRNERIASLREQVETLRKQRDHRLEAGTPFRVSPQNIVWIFCTGRSGSTWLGNLMSGLRGWSLWNEPLVGALFGEFYFVRAAHRSGGGVFLGTPHRQTWIKGIRYMVLQGIEARYPDIVGGNHLVIKEPHGSMGAPLLMEAFPESRIVLLVRDPRDIVASAMDARREGSWVFERMSRNPRKLSEGLRQDAERANVKLRGWEWGGLAETDPDAFVEHHAALVEQDMRHAREAYDLHAGGKALVRYEDLLSDTHGTLAGMYGDLGLSVEDHELRSIVDRLSWGNIPEEEKGSGKFYRRAEPGSWREDLTENQARAVEKAAGSIIEDFYGAEPRTS